MAKRKYYAYKIIGEKGLPAGRQGITDNWPECQEIVLGKTAKYKGFESEAAAEAWLNEGADYSKKHIAVEDGIYFDSGTGAGHGVEINVTDKKGEKLLHKVLDKKYINEKGHHFADAGTTNNFGELLACKYGLQIAIAENIKKVFGDSKLVIEYWSKGYIKKEVGSETVDLAGEVKLLRKKFEDNGGVIILISGGSNPADLGFHK